jgi:hypothetical protein
VSNVATEAKPPYSPEPGSGAWRVLSFFADNPEEELLTTDVVVKFGIDHRATYKRLQAAVEAGYLVRKKGPRNRPPVCLYCAGPALPTFAGLLAEEREQWRTAP